MKLVAQDIGRPHVSMDVGCHAFASFEPFSQGNTLLGYGMSLASAAGVTPMSAKRPVAVMGDGGFWHNGLLSGVASNLMNKGDGVLVIMKNGYASATGTQELLSSPEGIRNTRSRTRSSGIGVKWLRTVDNYDVGAMTKTYREAMTTDQKGLKVIVAEGECQLERQRRLRPVVAKDLSEGKAHGARQVRRGRGHLHRRPLLHPALGLPDPHGQGQPRPAAARPGGHRHRRLRRLRPVRRERARGRVVPFVLPGGGRAEPGTVSTGFSLHFAVQFKSFSHETSLTGRSRS